MPTLRELKKRLRSAQTTGQLAGAMRTVGTAKYGRANEKMNANAEYARECRALSAAAENARGANGAFRKEADHGPYEEETRTEKHAYVLISGNRGLCGGYNHELFSYFTEQVLSRENDPVVITCGRMAAEHCREKGIPVLREMRVSDVPSFPEAEPVSEYLTELFDSGSVSSVSFVYQRSINMLKQEPCVRQFLPIPYTEADASADDILFIPDEATCREALRPYCLAQDTYSVLLNCAVGAQAATVMAMRAACDNAKRSAQQLETAINRRRQAEVTQSVLETSSAPSYDRIR